MSVAGAFAVQAEHCERLGSPLMARLMRLLASRLDPGGAGFHGQSLDWSPQ